MKMNKKLMVLAMALSLGATVVGCTSKDVAQENGATTEDGGATEEGGTTSPEATISLTSEEIYTKIIEGLEMPHLQSPPDEIFNDTYGIDTDLLTDYIVMQPMMSGVITEVAVFQVKDAKDLETVMEGVNKRLDGLKNGGAFYPSHVEIVEKGQVVSKGNYVLFVADEQVDTIVENFNGLFEN